MVDFEKLNREKALENIQFELTAALPPTILGSLKFSKDPDANFLYIQPDGFLEPDDYGLVKASAEKLGGQWNRANGRFEVQAPKPKPLPAGQKQITDANVQSPVEDFIAANCKKCDSRSNPCNPKTPLGSYYMTLCLEVRRLRALEIIAKNAQQTLDWRAEQDKKRAEAPTIGPARSSAPAAAPATKRLVDVDGMKCTEERGQNGDYWKATEADNPTNDRYFELARAAADGKQFHDIGGKNSYVWLSQNQDWIGFKPCKPRAAK